MHVKSHRAPRTLLIQLALVCSTCNLKFLVVFIKNDTPLIKPGKGKGKKVQYKDRLFQMGCST